MIRSNRSQTGSEPDRLAICLLASPSTTNSWAVCRRQHRGLAAIGSTCRSFWVAIHEPCRSPRPAPGACTGSRSAAGPRSARLPRYGSSIGWSQVLACQRRNPRRSGGLFLLALDIKHPRFDIGSLHACDGVAALRRRQLLLSSRLPSGVTALGVEPYPCQPRIPERTDAVCRGRLPRLSAAQLRLPGHASAVRPIANRLVAHPAPDTNRPDGEHPSSSAAPIGRGWVRPNDQTPAWVTRVRPHAVVRAEGETRVSPDRRSGCPSWRSPSKACPVDMSKVGR